MKTGVIALLAALGLGVAAVLSDPQRPAGPNDVAKVLDQFHDAASRADEAAYFGLMAEDGVFLGTDASERWSKEQFRAYAKPYFSQGRGWTYLPRPNARFITVSADGGVAWFDEVLDNAKYGECRGSGVLVSSEKGWKIKQYNLTVPIPNDLMDRVAGLIKETKKPAPAGKDGKK
jgi:hypothetical protein